jgi:hypothetical protein
MKTMAGFDVIIKSTHLLGKREENTRKNSLSIRLIYLLKNKIDLIIIFLRLTDEKLFTPPVNHVIYWNDGW